jgi:Carboxypeptidase regulatory-like domain
MPSLNPSSAFHKTPSRVQRVGILFLALLLVSICPLRSHAQAASGSTSNATAPTGSITGKVSEKHGGPLAGARVSVSNVKTGVASRVATDVNGQFTVENLPAGAYQVTIAADGCAPQEDKVTVKPGHKSKVSTTLKPVEPQTPAPQ